MATYPSSRPPSSHRQRRSRAARGFTLAEILVALLIVAVALIGIAALYVDSASHTRESEPRLRAAELAEQIAARIKANPVGRTGYASVIGVVCNKDAQPKRAEEAAAMEAACWHEQVAAELPSGMGSVMRDINTTPPTYVVAVSWSPPQGGAASYVIRVMGDEQ